MINLLINTCAQPWDLGKDIETRKKWGSELLLVLEEEYTVKIMTLKPKHSCSFHLHKKKKESFILLKGTLLIDFIDSSTGRSKTIKIDKRYDTITLEIMTIHAFRCPEDQKGDTIFMECSTKDEVLDSYRFSGSY